MKLFLKLAILLVGLVSTGQVHSQTHYVKVGETLTLDVPSVSIGYVDKAIWACSNPAISFIRKSEHFATITVLKPFDGYATIELLFVQKYITDKGNPRALTYTKNYYVWCKKDGSKDVSTVATSISVVPEMKVEIGQKAKIYYFLYPEGSTVTSLYSTGSPGKYFNSIAHNKQNGYFEGYARAAGVDNISLYFYNEDEEKVSATCKVTVYDPTWEEPESMKIINSFLLSVGETKKLLPSLTPSSATTLYEWVSDNESAVSISDAGIYGKEAGIANIKVKALNGLTENSTVIVVKDKEQFPGLSKALNRSIEMLKTAENDNVK